MRKKRSSQDYGLTVYACYIGYVTQAIVNNFAPLLFVTIQSAFGIPLAQVALLASFNFAVQLAVDLLTARFADKIGYKPLIVFAHICAALGIVGLSVLPALLSNAYVGLMIATALYAIGGGIIEVLVSPIVEACPSKHKSAAMSLLHSFYCWGHVFVVVCSALFFAGFGVARWRFLAWAWAAVPLMNAFFFTRVPIIAPVEPHRRMTVRNLLSRKVFWMLALLMLCSGATELAMSQWVSAFAESGLGVSKVTGDLAGPCLFAVMMGLARVAYAKNSAKWPLRRFMAGSGVLSVCGFLLASLAPAPALAFVGCGLCGLAAGILWPGTLSLAAARFPAGGTTMFAFLALAGDSGCALGPALVGLVSGAAGNDLSVGLLAAAVFPVLLLVFLYMAAHRTPQ